MEFDVLAGIISALAASGVFGEGLRLLLRNKPSKDPDKRVTEVMRTASAEQPGLTARLTDDELAEIQVIVRKIVESEGKRGFKLSIIVSALFFVASGLASLAIALFIHP